MRKRLAMCVALLIACLLTACGTAVQVADTIEEASSIEEESAETRRERKQREQEEEEEREASRKELESAREEESKSESPWRDYVEPQLDDGMGSVFPSLKNPAGATALFMRYMQDYDLVNAYKCLSDYDEYTDDEMEYYYGKTDDLYDLFLTKVLKESRYSIINEEIRGDYAVVTVQCKAYSGEVIMDIYGEQLMEEGLFDYYVSYTGNLVDNINLKTIPMVKKEAKVYLVKCTDGLWRLDIDENDNGDAMEAIGGNLMEVISEYYYDYYYGSYWSDWYNYYGYGDDTADDGNYDSWYEKWYAENFD